MKIKTGIILCAGFGKRVQPITDTLPKPLIVYKEKTLLENTINLFGAQIKALAKGYQADTEAGSGFQGRGGQEGPHSRRGCRDRTLP